MEDITQLGAGVNGDCGQICLLRNTADGDVSRVLKDMTNQMTSDIGFSYPGNEARDFPLTI